MTKRELIRAIDQQVSEYLNFQTSQGGISSYTKAELVTLNQTYRLMIAYKRCADLLYAPYTFDQESMFVCGYIAKPSDFQLAQDLQAKATAIWFNPKQEVS